MVERPLISICVLTRDRLTYLRDSLATIRAQTYAPIEIVVSDNWSSDGTASHVREIEAIDSRVRLVRPPGPVGLYANHNYAFTQTRGDFVCFFHDDDIYAPSITRVYVEFLLSHPQIGVVCSDWHRIDEHGARFDTRMMQVPVARPGPTYIEDTLRTGRSSVALSGAMLRRAVLPPVPFDETGTIGFSDIVTWFRIAESWQIGHIGARLWSYRLHSAALSQRKGSVPQEHTDTFTAYAAEHLARHPAETERVRRWLALIRRFRFWAISYELARHAASGPRGGYRFARPDLDELLDALSAAAATLPQRAIAAAFRAQFRTGQTWPLALAARYAPAARDLLGMV